MFTQDQIVPIPKRITCHDGPPLLLGIPGRSDCQLEIACDAALPVVREAAELLRGAFRRLLLDEPGQAPAASRIRLELVLPPADLPAAGDVLTQGYSLKVDDSQATVSGFGLEGLRYGVTTLVQCLELSRNQLVLPQLDILDWPDLKTRGHFMESRYGSNLMTLQDWQHVVDHMAAMKMNQLVVSLYGCWVVQYDGRVSEYLYVPLRAFPQLKTPVVCRYYSLAKRGWVDEERLPPMVSEDFFGELVAYGKTRGVTVFPLFNSFGHNTLIPATFPAVSAKDEHGDATRTGFCTAAPETYELLFAIYDEIIDRYLAPNGIDAFHIGLDEVWDQIACNAEDIYKVRSPWCRCPVCRERSRKDIFIDHAIRLARHLKEKGMRHITMYHDMLIGHGQATDAEGCEAMLQALADNDLLDVVVIDWWTYSARREGLMFQTTRPELGLRRTVKPWNGYYHWTLLTNALPNVQLLAELGVREKAEGMQSYSAWDESYDRTHLGQADFAWNYEGTAAPERVNRHYARLHFAARYPEALRGLELLDAMVADTPGPLSHYRLLLSTLSYYFYSYVKADKPYPRHFPGEAIAQLLADRPAVEAALLAIGSMAAEAVRLFSGLSRDARCDQRIAARLAYEARNIRCLADDYRTLLAMHDLGVSQDPQRYVRIQAMAERRKQARLDLMAVLGQVKEPFLQPSHQRNHSIFMQYFADLEGYLATCPPEDIRLDFTDNTHFASPAFWKLR